MSGRNLGASIRDRLLNKARAGKMAFNLLLTHQLPEPLEDVTEFRDMR